MGPLYQLLRDVIESLRDREGAYLRCVAEEYSALIDAYQYERERGRVHPEWLAASVVFGEFLLGAQEKDGSWRRAYDFDGRAITTLESWFGQTEVQQKSSTAAVVPFLLDLHGLTGDPRFLESARRGGDYAERNFVDRIRFNGVNVGWTDSPGERATQAAIEGRGDAWLDARAAEQPFGRLLAPDDVARLTLFLLSDCSSPMTGAIIDQEQWVVGARD